MAPVAISVLFWYNRVMEIKETQTSNTELVTISRAEYERLQGLSETLDQLQQRYDRLLEIIAIAQKNKYGSKAEPASEEVMEQLCLMFDEPEATVWVEQKQEEKEPTQVAAYTRARKSGSALDNVPEGVKVVTIDHKLTGDDLLCPECGAEMVEIGKETRRTLVVVPAEVHILEDVYHTYACKACEKETEETVIVKPPKEPTVIPGGFASPEIIAWLDTQKYVMASPLYRLEQYLKRMKIDLSRQTMSNWMIKSANMWLKPIYDALHRHLIQYQFLHADETPLQVLHEPGKSAQSKSYMWLYRTGKHAEWQIVLFQYRPDRKQCNPEAFLEGFHGYLHVDGYSGYNGLALMDVTRVGCLSHLRRKFTDAEKAASKGNKSPTITQAIAYCSRVFKIEEELANLSCEERFAQRQLRVKPLLETFFNWAETRSAAPKSKLGEALAYARNQRPYIMNCLLDGHLEFSNNLAERTIKPFVISRKNFLFANTPAGAESSAVIFSLIQTAIENKLDPYKYLVFVFSNAPKLAQSKKDWAEDLLPWNAPDDCKVPGERKSET